jgi:methyltransferase
MISQTTLWAYGIVLLVALQRLLEMRYAERNTAALRARGAIEIGARHYPLIVVLHTGWLVAIAALMPNPTIINWWLLGLFLVLQLLRVWVIATLGPYWTTRIIALPGAPLVTRGPYRFLRHPNYVVVACEIAVLPLVFAELWVAVVFSILNAALLAWRIRLEEGTLDSRRHL